LGRLVRKFRAYFGCGCWAWPTSPTAFVPIQPRDEHSSAELQPSIPLEDEDLLDWEIDAFMTLIVFIFCSTAWPSYWLLALLYSFVKLIDLRFTCYGLFLVTYLHYYIKHLRIGGSIFCHDNFLLYPFYPSIRRIIFIFDWSNVCDRVHWSSLSLHFFPLYTIISIILFFI
jgi:hypothetical protein